MVLELLLDVLEMLLVDRAKRRRVVLEAVLGVWGVCLMVSKVLF